jgi:hypothetical protein
MAGKGEVSVHADQTDMYGMDGFIPDERVDKHAPAEVAEVSDISTTPETSDKNTENIEAAASSPEVSVELNKTIDENPLHDARLEMVPDPENNSETISLLDLLERELKDSLHTARTTRSGEIDKLAIIVYQRLQTPERIHALAEICRSTDFFRDLTAELIDIFDEKDRLGNKTNDYYSGETMRNLNKREGEIKDEMIEKTRVGNEIYHFLELVAKSLESALKKQAEKTTS